MQTLDSMFSNRKFSALINTAVTAGLKQEAIPPKDLAVGDETNGEVTEVL